MKRDMNRTDAAVQADKPAANLRSAGAGSTGGGAPSGSAREGVVSELIRDLTRRERLVLMLRYTEELTVAEIAVVLEIAATEVERMLESISERVRRRVQPTYGRAVARMA
jgi:DNA-directed RNA polymerase specialized sigma24 family protein